MQLGVLASHGITLTAEWNAVAPDGPMIELEMNNYVMWCPESDLAQTLADLIDAATPIRKDY